MRVRALKTIRGDYGLIARGAEGEVADATAKKLIALGYVVAVGGKPAAVTADEKPADDKPDDPKDTETPAPSKRGRKAKDADT